MVALEGLGIALVCVAVVTYVVSIITVIIRCWVRLKLMKFFGWDDVLMVIAQVSLLQCCSRVDMRKGAPEAELSCSVFRYFRPSFSYVLWAQQ